MSAATRPAGDSVVAVLQPASSTMRPTRSRFPLMPGTLLDPGGSRQAREVVLHAMKALPWLAWGGALAATALGVGYLGWTLTALEGELTERAREVTSLQQAIARQQELLKLLASPDTQALALGGPQ